MFGYGALLDNSFGERLGGAINDFTNLLRDVPFYWYLIALAVLVLFFKLLTKK